MRLTPIASNIALLLLIACVSPSATKNLQASGDYPRFIKTKADSFYITGSNWMRPWAYAIGKSDTVSPGTDGYKGGYIQLVTKEDTLQFNYTSTPYQQHHTISVISPKDTTVCILRFNQHIAEYSEAYIKEHEGKVQFVIPETFELANIIWALSPTGKKASNLRKEGKYYEEVLTYFRPHESHPIFKKLQFPEATNFAQYFSFRENSICFQFRQDSLTYSGPYYHVHGGFENFGGLFKELLPLVEDFAIKSNFKAFYHTHLSYYNRLIERQRQLMPVKDMWSWLESEFPGKINSYKIVFSPLIGSSHSTQNFSFFGNRTEWYTEALMFVSGPEVIEENKSLNEKQREGLLSGIVFTEIDHNYVNPITRKYKDDVEKIFSNRQIWTMEGGDADNYTSAESVFNEYMTHSLFCLYALSKYDRDVATFIISKREALMSDRRNFIKFSQFNEKLVDLYKTKLEKERVIDLYPKILEWAASVH